MRRVSLLFLAILLCAAIPASAIEINCGCGGTGGITIPGGPTTGVQFNDGGAFNGDAGLVYNKTTDILTAGGRIDVNFLDPDNGKIVTCSDSGATALATMSTLNTANLTANSLQKRAIAWAQGRGCLTAGTVAGTPQ